jgi:hypothetical protein
MRHTPATPPRIPPAEGVAMTDQGQAPPVPNLDEFVESWRKAAVDTERRWNEFFNEVMGTEAFAQALAHSMDGILAVQTAWARGMDQYLRALSIPTQSDLAALAERVALLDQKIDRALAMLGVASAVAPSDGTTNGSKRRRTSPDRRQRPEG